MWLTGPVHAPLMNHCLALAFLLLGETEQISVISKNVKDDFTHNNSQ